MARLKKYREILESYSVKEEAYEADLDRKRGGCTLDIDNAPEVWSSPYTLGGKAGWVLDMSERTSGLEIYGARIVWMYFTIEIEDSETGEPDEVEIELGEEDLRGIEMNTNIGKPDFYLNVIEIDMHGSEDPSKWTYSLDIGN